MNDRSHRRKLGQNYLIDPVILFEIERAINPQMQDTFFEIGPGTGALTKSLIGEEIKIIAMDLDEDNIKSLQKKFSHANHEFIHGDILHAPLDFLSKQIHRVVGNLPYNISTQIILKLIHFTPYIADISSHTVSFPLYPYGAYPSVTIVLNGFGKAVYSL